MSRHSRAALACAVIGGLALAGCANPPQRTSHARSSMSAAPSSAPVMPRTGTTPSDQLPAAPDGMVGVAACDQYLSSYKACHRAAAIFAPGQIDAHYEVMRNSLLRDARDPLKRPTLDQRCRALASQLQDALHGKSCDAAPAAGASSD